MSLIVYHSTMHPLVLITCCHYIQTQPSTTVDTMSNTDHVILVVIRIVHLLSVNTQTLNVRRHLPAWVDNVVRVQVLSVGDAAATHTHTHTSVAARYTPTILLLLAYTVLQHCVLLLYLLNVWKWLETAQVWLPRHIQPQWVQPLTRYEYKLTAEMMCLSLRHTPFDPYNIATTIENIRFAGLHKHVSTSTAVNKYNASMYLLAPWQTSKTGSDVCCVLQQPCVDRSKWISCVAGWRGMQLLGCKICLPCIQLCRRY